MGYPCRIIGKNVFDTADLTSTVAPFATTPLINLKNDRRARICRWRADAGAQAISGTWNGDAKQVGGVSLDRFNISPAGTVRFRGFANADWTGSTLVDTGTVPAYDVDDLGAPFGTSIFDGFLGYKYWVDWYTKATIKSFTFDIDDPTNSDGYIDISRAILGDYIQPTYNAQYGLGLGWRSRTEQEESDGGSLFSDGKIPRRMLSLDFAGVTPAERIELFDFLRYVEKRKSFLISVQPGEGAEMDRDFTIPLAKLLDLPDINWTHPEAHALRLSIVEA